MHDLHGINNVILKVIVADAFIKYGVVLTCPGCAIAYSSKAHSFSLLVTCVESVQSYNAIYIATLMEKR